MLGRSIAGLTVALLSAQTRELFGGLRTAVVARWCSPSATTIRISAMSIGWLQTYEDESGKHRDSM
jgi:hypothetical protein